MAQPAQSESVSGITFTTGGVGEDEMAEMAAIQNRYDFKLFLVGQSGAYLSDIVVSISDIKGNDILQTTTKGPLLLADLPTGTYIVKGQKNGYTIEQQIALIRNKLRVVYFRFPNE